VNRKANCVAVKRPKTWISRLGDASAWISIAAFFTIFIAENFMESTNPRGNGPWPEGLPRPASFDFALSLRNFGLAAAPLTGLIALPRRKAIVSLILTTLYSAYVYWGFVHY
jgi:hypothetical protein